MKIDGNSGYGENNAGKQYVMVLTSNLIEVELLAKLPRCELLRRSIRSPGGIFVASEACPAERLT